MRFFLTLLITALAFQAVSQTVKFETFELPPNSRFGNLQDSKMSFPIVRSGNNLIDSLINFNLKNSFTNSETPNDPLDSTLIKWAGDQIISLGFEVTYNKDGILSLNISAEGCGAYCTHWIDYFNYSTITGQPLSISEVVDTTGLFKKQVYKQKTAQYLQQKEDLKEMLLNKEGELEQSAYDWAMDNYTECEESFNLESFALYPDYLQIIERCSLPNAIKNLTPVIELKFKYLEIKKHLKIKNIGSAK